MEGMEDIMKAGTDRGHIQKGGTRLTLPTEDCYCIIVAGRSALSSLGPLPNKFTNATLNNAGSYGETSPLGGVCWDSYTTVTHSHYFWGGSHVNTLPEQLARA